MTSISRLSSLLVSIFCFTFLLGTARAEIALTPPFKYGYSELLFDGNYIYFGDDNSGASNLYRVPKMGGTTQVVAAGTWTGGAGIIRMDASPSKIYFNYGGYNQSTIEEISRDGTDRRVVATFSGGRFDAVIGSHVYFNAGFCCMYRTATSGTSPPEFIAGSLWVRSEEKDGQFLYFAEYYSRNVYRFDSTSTAPPQLFLAGFGGYEGWVYLNSTSVFVGSPGAMKMISKSGGSVTNIALPSNAFPRGVDDQFIYFSENIWYKLWRQPIDGSAPPQLLSQNALVAEKVYAKDGQLYWIDGRSGWSNAVLYRMAASGIEANAGPAQSVVEGANVVLDGRASDGANLSYSWMQVAGPMVNLSGSSSSVATFIAPTLAGGFGSQTLTFLLTVSNGVSTSTTLTNVVVSNVNHAPVADAGMGARVYEGAQVSLNGANSFDPDVDPITYAWSQVSGPPVQLSSVSGVSPTFSAPVIGGLPTNSATLVFELAVSDGALSNTAMVSVVVERVNHPPTANAGSPQTVRPGATIALNGSLSSDPDGDNMQFNWQQIAGPIVTLTGSTGTSPTFVAPPVASPETLVFQLVTSDGLASSVPSNVTITVTNGRPVCSAASASPPLLWPPNHTLYPVRIIGVTDPDNDTASITLTDVTQDEPVNGTGDGDTAPDALITAGGALLRAERAGAGDGRVYVLSFSASDGSGGICSGTVRVTVPKNMSPAGVAIDGGLRFRSTDLQ